MFGKSGFIVRALFVSFIVGSLVACTFEGGAEEQGQTTSADTKAKKGGGKGTKALDGGPGAENDADVAIDGGPADNDADIDGGPGGGWGEDAGPGNWDEDASYPIEDAGPAPSNDW